MFTTVVVHPDPANMANPQTWRVKVNAEVNDRRIASYNFNVPESNVERAIQEALDPQRLNAGRNTLHFEIDEGRGIAYISDVVLWYHTS
jgi:hypothetical protein